MKTAYRLCKVLRSAVCLTAAWFVHGVGVAQPANDSFANATVLTPVAEISDVVAFSGSILNSTSEPGEDSLFPDAILERGTTWWKWSCEVASSVEFVAYSSTASLLGAAYSSLNTAPSFSQLTEVSPLRSDLIHHPERTHEAALAVFTGEAGRTYWFAVVPGLEQNVPSGPVSGKLTVIPLPPAPATTNDLFATRMILSGTNRTVISNNSRAGTEPGENIGGGSAFLQQTLWYSWTAPTNGVLRVTGSTSVPNFIFSIGTYRGDAVDALTPAPSTPDGGIAVRTGDRIELQIGSVHFTWGGGGGSGPFTLRLKLEVPTPTSPNDAFEERIEIATARYHFDGSIYGATNEPGEPLPTPNADHTLWWKFVAPGDGLLNVLLQAGQFEGKLRVYEGTELTGLTPTAPLKETRYRVQGGGSYAIQLASGPLTSGTFGLDVRFHSASNDFFAGSEQLEGTNIVYDGNFTLATLEPDEPPGGTNSVWLSWAAPFHGPVRYSLATRPLFQWVSIHTGPALGHLQAVPITGLQNGINSFIARPGEVYHFQIGGDADDFQFSLHAEPFRPASNDHFADAEPVEGQYVHFVPRSVVGATLELGEPLHGGAVTEEEQKSIWWKWRASRDGFLNVSASGLYIPTILLAVYQGSSVAALGEVARGTNAVRFRAVSGQTYHLAAVVPASAVGDIQCSAQQFGMSDVSAILPGNILREPSWENTGLGPQYWGGSGALGGYVNERGGADGVTWPVLGTGAKIWQDIPTIPGREYAVQFAYLIGRNLSGCCGLGGVKVSWDNRELGITYVPEAETLFWHWNVYTARASNTVSRITFENIHRNLEMDAFSVVDLNAPPSIVTPPSSVSTLAGGVAAFNVIAAGTAPLSYQWYFNGAPMPGRNAATLVLDPASISNVGSYTVSVRNALGQIVSAPVSLLVDAPKDATILLQPTGGTVPVGSYFNLSVAAAGTPPLTYQWFLDGKVLTGTTNRVLQFTNVQASNAGFYSVRVANRGGSVYSLPASLLVTNASGGGAVDFRNRWFAVATSSNQAPVFDLDGLTRLNGPSFVAQLYAGPTIETMLPAALPTPFLSGFQAGFFGPQNIALANVAPGDAAVAQVRAWEIGRGSSYEEARALGGKFGSSEVISFTAGGGLLPPARLASLTSFTLRAGLPAFTVGVLTLVERKPHRVFVWSLRGETGFRYVIERATRPHFSVWRPFQVVTNVTGTVLFSDSPAPGEGTLFYRARILD